MIVSNEDGVMRFGGRGAEVWSCSPNDMWEPERNKKGSHTLKWCSEKGFIAERAGELSGGRTLRYVSAQGVTAKLDLI